jgi:hypothetical protein
VARQTGAVEELPADLKTVWWHEQADSYAFCADLDLVPQTERFMSAVPEDHIEEWFNAHADEAAADSVVARVSEFATLRSPLYVHWRGDKQEIAAALRAQGLRVQVPDSDSTCIAVLPARATFHAFAENGEVVLHLDGEQVLLTAADAKKLARKVGTAAREAVAQVPML